MNSGLKRLNMANIFTTIQRKVNQGRYEFGKHFLKELAAEQFKTDDAFQVIRRSYNFFSFTDDESHIRYAFEGELKDGRMLCVVVFLNQGIVIFKTAYEI